MPIRIFYSVGHISRTMNGLGGTAFHKNKINTKMLFGQNRCYILAAAPLLATEVAVLLNSLSVIVLVCKTAIIP